MRSLPVTCGLALLLLAGCGGNSNNSSNTSNASNSTGSSNSTASSNNAVGSNTSTASTSKGDFSTPKAAVETFISASASRDAELLSRCVAAESSGEFRKLREKRASAKELDELAEFVQGGQILDVKEKSDSAIVSVKFKERTEEIAMTKAADGWKIVDF